MATREITCKTCATSFNIETTGGRLPIFCQECRAARDREHKRAALFRWRAKNPDKWQAIQSRHIEKKRTDPELRRRRRDYEAQRLYGLAPEELQNLVASQEGACAICDCVPQVEDTLHPRYHRGYASAMLHIDHCHATGKVRGLLCGKCNALLGLADENPATLLAAVEYLARHK